MPAGACIRHPCSCHLCLGGYEISMVAPWLDQGTAYLQQVVAQNSLSYGQHGLHSWQVLAVLHVNVP